MCCTFVAVVEGRVWPSPKSQARVVITPLEVSEKFTLSGTEPLVGEALKSARGVGSPTTKVIEVAWALKLVICNLEAARSTSEHWERRNR